MKIRVLLSCACALAASSAPFSSLAAAADATKNYPDRPIRMIVPNAPGSSVDTLSRIMAAKLSEVLGQQVISDNRAGAGGVIGMEIAKAAIPDGYTLISATTAASTIAVLLQKVPTYDPVSGLRSRRAVRGDAQCSGRKSRAAGEVGARTDRLLQSEARTGQHGIRGAGFPKSPFRRVFPASRKIRIVARAVQRAADRRSHRSSPENRSGR